MLNHGMALKRLAKSAITSAGTPFSVAYVWSVGSGLCDASTCVLLLVRIQSMKRNTLYGWTRAKKSG
jgi:hypothetical protein